MRRASITSRHRSSGLTEENLRQFAVASSVNDGGYTIGLTLPSPAQAGSLLLLQYAADGQVDSFTPPVGFTATGPGAPSPWAVGNVFYKIAAGGEQAFTMGHEGAPRERTACLVEVTGVASAAPIDQFVFTNYNDTVGTVTPGGPTAPTAAAGELALAFWSNNNAATVNYASNTPAWTDGFVPVLDYGCTARTDSSAPAMAVGLKPIPAAGSIVSTSFGYADGYNDESILFLLTLRAG